MLHRRDFLMVIGATGLISGCMSGPPKSSTVTVAAVGQAGMNLAADGGERPVTLLILRLKDIGKFNAADSFALQDPATALGADLVGSDQLTIAPGKTASKTVAFPPEATYLGVVALFREPGGRTWRRTAPIKPESTVTAKIVLNRGGMTLALA
ncbi:type VI secretion system lipoprotein TssJ [Sinorhizobium fredii]|uniref:type VI secretion system lipoprotein TssJ n=1 Tax=Rhizobium fredii TaxID=380 RepID=UPI0012982379|nr:type VI secretion system lipoprotein TssJ [Sinorhizobium fredii]MQW95961.1 type VI secretion system lipoprotein TssJ [Sinorhizobium fredii]UTY46962.1 type VI secretion system lipoprotein TssJ [Sinorhizobium fredii]